jgi:hypothetical protein
VRGAACSEFAASMGLRSGGYFGRYRDAQIQQKPQRKPRSQRKPPRRCGLPAANLHHNRCEIEGIRMSVNAKRNLIQVLVPWSISAAIKEAAAHKLTSNSEYIRRALVERLRSDGVDPARFAPADWSWRPR